MAAAAVMHVLTMAFKMVDRLLDEEDWPEKESEGAGPLANRAQASIAVACSLIDLIEGDQALHLALRRDVESMMLPFCLAQQGSVRPKRD